MVFFALHTRKFDVWVHRYGAVKGGVFMKLASADLKSLAVFLAVAEHRGFAGAQKALHLSQSAISFHIRALEERLGFVVCRRGRQGFELTDRGLLAYERAKRLLAGVDDFESEMGELRRTVIGNLRIGIVDNTISDTNLSLPRVIREFLRKNRQAKLDITVDSPERLVTRIANGELHICIMPQTSPLENLQFRPIYVEEHRVYCGRNHPLFNAPESALTLEVLEAQSFVVRPYANLQELKSFPNARVGAHASNMEAQAMMILSGHFIGNLPCHYAQQWVNCGELRLLVPDQVMISSPFCVVSRSGIRPSLIVRSFIQEMVAQSLRHQHERVSI
jgi:DNA-binding transcriptional LysR family regulator